jgi:hypothetical protein
MDVIADKRKSSPAIASQDWPPLTVKGTDPDLIADLTCPGDISVSAIHDSKIMGSSSYTHYALSAKTVRSKSVFIRTD